MLFLVKTLLNIEVLGWLPCLFDLRLLGTIRDDEELRRRTAVDHSFTPPGFEFASG